ncbi:MAG: hypothetical protein IIU58_04770 [Clostridia bacterium]|nr:hypothetical protein [Clostridia bacterium]
MSEPITRERLSRLTVLRREVTRTKRRLAQLRNSRDKEIQGKAYEMAYGRALAAFERYLTKLQTEEAELLLYIETIEDASMRELLMLRYYDGIRPWQRVAFLMGEHDESYVRRKHDAFWKKVSGKQG